MTISRMIPEECSDYKFVIVTIYFGEMVVIDKKCDCSKFDACMLGTLRLKRNPNNTETISCVILFCKDLYPGFDSRWLSGIFFSSSWLTNVDGMKDLWCSIVQFGCYQHKHK